MLGGFTSADKSINPFGREAKAEGLLRWIPGCALFKDYHINSFVRDLIAGLVLTTILVPVGMGYSEASGLPPICGLYASVSALVAYAIAGQSRIMVLGPDSALVAITAASILPLAQSGSAKALGLASALAIISGCVCILAGIARFGFITDLLSKPIRYGYVNAIALTIFLGQLAKMMGLDTSGYNFIQLLISFGKGLQTQKINWISFGIGAASVLIILSFKKFFPKISGIAVVVVLATVLVSCFNLEKSADVSVVGVLPQGLPEFQVPGISLQEWTSLFTAGTALALVSFADMSVVSRMFAFRGGYEVDDNQEMIALGAANIAAGCFQGFAVTSSATRTPVAEAAGGRTQVTGLVGALCIALLLVFGPTLLSNVPDTVLAAVVVSSCLSLLEFSGVLHLYRVRKMEFVFSIACLLGVLLFGVIQGIFIAITLALLSFIWRAWRPYNAVLGRVDGMKGYHDVSRHPEAKLIPGLVIFRWDAPLFFANARVFEESILKAISEAPIKVKRVVVGAEPVTDIDSSAADVLADLQKDLQEAQIELCFAEMKGPVKDQLKLYRLFESIGPDNFFPTIGLAVDAYLEAHDVDWKDWDD